MERVRLLSCCALAVAGLGCLGGSSGDGSGLQSSTPFHELTQSEQVTACAQLDREAERYFVDQGFIDGVCLIQGLSAQDQGLYCEVIRDECLQEARDFGGMEPISACDLYAFEDCDLPVGVITGCPGKNVRVLTDFAREFSCADTFQDFEDTEPGMVMGISCREIGERCERRPD